MKYVWKNNKDDNRNLEQRYNPAELQGTIIIVNKVLYGYKTGNKIIYTSDFIPTIGCYINIYAKTNS